MLHRNDNDELTKSTSAMSEVDRLVKDHWKLENQTLELGVCAQWIASRSRMCQSANDNRRTTMSIHPSYQIGQWPSVTFSHRLLSFRIVIGRRPRQSRDLEPRPITWRVGRTMHDWNNNIDYTVLWLCSFPCSVSGFKFKVPVCM